MPLLFIQRTDATQLKHIAVMAERHRANSTLSHLLKNHQVEESLKIKTRGNHIFIPIKEGTVVKGNHVVLEEEFTTRKNNRSPQSIIHEKLESEGLLLQELPERWVRIGSSITLRLPDVDAVTKGRIAEVYATVLRVNSVYDLTGRIRGQFREPELQLVYGPGGDVTHTENGIRFTLDPSKVMFSPGNVNVRTAVRDLDLSGKVVIDLFAGIGYFTIGIARYSGPSVVHACEINPTSFRYLEKNIRENGVEDAVVPYLGDSRIVAPRVKADVVVMGNFISYAYLPHAISRLKSCGRILMHDLVSSDGLGNYSYHISKRLRNMGWNSTVQNLSVVKSFSPHMWHVSIDVKVSRRL